MKYKNSKAMMLSSVVAIALGVVAIAPASSAAPGFGTVFPTVGETRGDALLDVSRVTTNRHTLAGAVVDRLADAMTTDQRDIKALNGVLAQFYALNAPDLERVLKAMRERTYDAELAKFEPAIAKAIAALNAQSVSAHGVPFHLAAARGLNLSADETFAAAGLAAVFGGGPQRNQSAAAACPSSDFPLRIPYTGWVNRLQWAWSYQSWSYPAIGGGCHARHGTFSRTIRQWNSFNPNVVCMVYANGYGGGTIASDGNRFLYKWWTIPACSATSGLILGSMRSRY